MPLEPNAVTVALLVVAGLVMAILGRAVGRAIAEMRWRRRPGGATDAPPVVTVVVRHAIPPTPSAASPSATSMAWPDPVVPVARPAAPASRLADMPAPIAYRRPSPTSPALARTAQQRPLDAGSPPARGAVVPPDTRRMAPGHGMLAASPLEDPIRRSSVARRRGLLLSSTAALAVVAIVALGVAALLPPSPQVGVLGASASPRSTDTAVSPPGGPPNATTNPDGSTAIPSPAGGDGGGTPGTPGGGPGGGNTAGEPGGGPVPGTPGPDEPTPPAAPSPPASGDPSSSPGTTPPPPTASPNPTPAPTPAPTPDPTAAPTPAPTPAPTATAAPTPVPPDVSFTWTATGLIVKFTNGTSGPHRWSWEFGDGTASTIRNPSHTYAAAGTYVVRLTATASNGASATYAASVTVP